MCGLRTIHEVAELRGTGFAQLMVVQLGPCLRYLGVSDGITRSEGLEPARGEGHSSGRYDCRS